MDCGRVYSEGSTPATCENVRCKRPLFGAGGSGVVCVRDARVSRRGFTTNAVTNAAAEDESEVVKAAIAEAVVEAVVEAVDEYDVAVEKDGEPDEDDVGEDEDEAGDDKPNDDDAYADNEADAADAADDASDAADDDASNEEEEPDNTPANAPVREAVPNAPMRPFGAAKRACKLRAIDLIGVAADQEEYASDQDVDDESFIQNWSNHRAVE